MPPNPENDVISYEIDEERAVLWVRIGDGVTPDHLLASMNALRADARHDALRPAIFDLRGLTQMPPMEAMQKLAAVGPASPIALSTPRALLVNTGADFEAAHHFSLLAQRQGRHFGVFTSVEAATRWLLARPRATTVE